MGVAFVTSNRNKRQEFSALLGSGLEFMDFEYPEIQAGSVEDVSVASAGLLAARLGRPVVVEDAGLFISALNGFPGVYTKHVTGMIGNRGILKLMKGVADRSCAYRSAVGFCAPGEEPVCFRGIEQGSIALSERGSNGWGNDCIFVPAGESRTYAEIKKGLAPAGRFRAESVKQLRDFLSSRDY
ncbi:non-canonical purine NTP pyrophosphatase [Candidatus Woesearchaeota archaeon]|nr:non-canonical purine NTP pyrophosphatase [Candidatus Woesearchaeota archaeon]